MATWDLTHLYLNDENLYEDLERVKLSAKEFENVYKGTFKDLKSKAFLVALDEYESISESIGRIGTYAYLKFASDSRNGGFLAKIQKELSLIEENLVFFELEFNQIDENRQNKIISKSKDKSFYLETLKDEKIHQLSILEEKLLLKKELVGSSAFSRLFDEHFSKLKFDFRGEKLSEEQILSKLYDSDREIRREASLSLGETLKANSHLLTYIFNMVKSDLAIDVDIRKYKSPEEIRHKDNQITQKSVDALVDTVCSNFDLVSNYYEVKREILGLEKLYDYDRYAPIDESEQSFSFESSKEIVLSAFKSFSEKFYEIAKMAFDDNWLDVYPRDYKRGGAFSHSAVPSAHPYVMLNHTDRRRDLFTLAHELGHLIHQYLSRDVGYINSDTPLTTSETASIFAEMLVFDYIKSNLNRKDLISLYATKLEDIYATLFRQTIFTTFERRVHSFSDEISSDDLNQIWFEENQKMFGDSLELSENYKYWWSYIPHFIHSPFYCYAYSYGQLLVLALYRSYKDSENKEEFIKKYIKFLSSGGSKSPKDLIKKFGFDIESSDFWQNGIDEVRAILGAFKSEVKEDFKAKGVLSGSSLDTEKLIDDIIKMAKD